MSTKRTLKVQLDDTGAGFHLYQDTEELDDDGNGPVHLDLENVTFEAGAGHKPGGGGVDVTIPRAWARALGLLTPDTALGTPLKNQPEETQ